MQSTKQNELIGNWITNKEDYALAITYSEKKIGLFDRIEMGDIVDVLANWRLMLGVTSDTTQEELIFITQFIYDEYKYLTLSDLKIAKNWAIMGKIDIGFVTQKTFSSYYIAKCITAYEGEKRRIINDLHNKKERYEMRMAIEKPKEISVEEEAKNFIEHIVVMYNAHKEGREIYDIGDMVYNWLKAIGLMKPTNLEVQDALVYATEKIRQLKYEGYTKFNLDTDAEENRRKKYAREYCVSKLFDKTMLSDLISKINIEYFKNKK